MNVHTLLLVGLLGSDHLDPPGDVSLEDACALKVPRAKGEALGVYAVRVVQRLADFKPMFAVMRPPDEKLPSMLRSLAELKHVTPCPLPDRWELEALLGQSSSEPPASGLEFIVSAGKGRSDDVTTALRVRAVLEQDHLKAHLRFGACAHGAGRRACVRVRLLGAPTEATYRTLRDHLLAQQLGAAYPVRVAGNVLGAPLEQAQLQALCREASTPEALAAVNTQGFSPELQAVVAAGRNVPSQALAKYLLDSVRDFNFTGPCGGQAQ